MLKFTLLSMSLFLAVGTVFGFKASDASAQDTQQTAAVKSITDDYSQIRNQTLTGTRTDFGLDAPPSDAPAWGVLMEVGFPEDTTALICMSDASANVYFRSGGRLIAVSERQIAGEAALAFVRLAGLQKRNMAVTTTFPLPQPGRAVFYVLTDSGVFTADADVEALRQHRHELSPLFDAGQDVIAHLDWSTAKRK
jgi:hypothetical protein